MKKILITGISGFAGSFLAQHLLHTQKDIAMYGTYVSESGLSNLATIKESVTLHKVDLVDFDSVQSLITTIKPDEIYHLAALPSPADSFKEPALFMQNNINAQLHILEAVKNDKLKDTKILVVSSAEVYGLVGKDDLPIDEDTPLRPVSPYGVSKIAQDFLGLQYYLAYKQPIIRVRPFNHIGPRLSEKFAASAFAKKIAEIEKGKREAVLTVGNLQARRDMTDVRDIVNAYALLMEKGEVGEVYNLGRGQSYKIADILDMLLSFSTASITIQTDPDLLRPNDIPDLVCDSTKITTQTGWEPEISLETSLQDTLDYWRNIV